MKQFFLIHKPLKQFFTAWNFCFLTQDEEDEYDKVALGKEDGGKGVSMEDAISRPCGVRIRDPCANHAAAKMRLKEDELEANK